MSQCQHCGAAMVPMIMSSFCPNDCDRPIVERATSSPSKNLSGYDTGYAIAVHGIEGGSYYVYLYTRDAILADAPMPPSKEPLRAWWVGGIDSPDKQTAVAKLTDWANIGTEPGWEFAGDYLKNSMRRFMADVNSNINSVLVFAWVDG